MMKQGTEKEWRQLLMGSVLHSLHSASSQYRWCLLKQDTDVTLLNKLMGFFLIQGGKDEGNAANSRYLE